MEHQKELEAEEQIRHLAEFAEKISALNLNELLEITVKEIPSLLKSRGASIYLLPELVPQHDDGNLMDENFQTISAHTITQDFIVLAATSRSKAKRLLGRAFYLPDESSLTGWVF